MKGLVGQRDPISHHRRFPAAAKELWGQIGLYLPHDPALKRSPVQRPAALQQNAVDVLRAQLCHQRAEVQMALPLRNHQYLAAGVEIGAMPVGIAFGGGQNGGRGAG